MSQKKKVSEGRILDFSQLNVSNIDDLVTFVFDDGATASGMLASFGTSANGVGWVRLYDHPETYVEPQQIVAFTIDYEFTFD